jgi:hypothetical protein
MKNRTGHYIALINYNSNLIMACTLYQYSKSTPLNQATQAYLAYTVCVIYNGKKTKMNGCTCCVSAAMNMTQMAAEKWHLSHRSHFHPDFVAALFFISNWWWHNHASFASPSSSTHPFSPIILNLIYFLCCYIWGDYQLGTTRSTVGRRRGKGGKPFKKWPALKKLVMTPGLFVILRF